GVMKCRILASGAAMTRLGLVAHDQKKAQLVAWCERHRARLAGFELCATGTTGAGGDAQLGAMIAEGRLDALVFFQDPLTSMPHDVDVKALTRLATLYNVLFAVNEATADAVLAVL